MRRRMRTSRSRVDSRLMLLSLIQPPRRVISSTLVTSRRCLTRGPRCLRERYVQSGLRPITWPLRLASCSAGDRLGPLRTLLYVEKVQKTQITNKPTCPACGDSCRLTLRLVFFTGREDYTSPGPPRFFNSSDSIPENPHLSRVCSMIRQVLAKIQWFCPNGNSSHSQRKTFTISSPHIQIRVWRQTRRKIPAACGRDRL